MKRLTPPPSRHPRIKDKDRDPNKPKRTQNPKSANPFTFRGLLWCTECDRKFVAQRQHNHDRYFCGSRETTNPCDHAKHSILEEEFLPWVDDLIAGFELGRMGGLKLGKRSLVAKETAAGAVQSIDARIKRLDTRFAMGTIEEPEFKSELETLRRTRASYAAHLADEPKPAELEGIAALWKSGDSRIRWELLSALFEKLHVTNRQIIGYTPRGDRVGRVALLLGTARDYLADSRGLLPDPEVVLYAEGEGPGAAPSTRDVWRRGRDLNSRWASDP